jgi:hypothetical protein
MKKAERRKKKTPGLKARLVTYEGEMEKLG